uniref:(-)-ent-kaurene synthase n=1 Tax=Picea glauca TaxID=3330 RepID=D2X8G1_PICGL|nr:(-)-ent-kaurene synthase [Picea glauca]
MKREQYTILNEKESMAEELILRIKRMFSEIENTQTSASAYDTAWVAMVPSLDSSQQPQFPQCLSWIIDNQLLDGSWGIPYLIIKDRLCHTLACVIALRKWNAGNQNVETGLRFLRENIEGIVHEDEYTPIGFQIIFPAMLEEARGLGLELPYDLTPIKLMLTHREKIMKGKAIDHMHEYDSSLIYTVEGIHKIVDWNKVLKHQNKDGSLFNSPSATACALMHTRKSNCLEYLSSMLQKLGNGVPSVYPINLYARISMIDRLQRLGLARHFRNEIIHALDDIYRYWMQKETSREGKSLTPDIVSTSIAFMLLRLHGYDVPADVFCCYHLHSIEQSGEAVTAMLSLYRASQIMFPGETILEEIKTVSRKYLDKRKENGRIYYHNIVMKDLRGEVEYALSVPWYASLERIENRRYIDQYGVNDTWIAKTSYKIPCISNDLFLALAKQDYNICQAIQQKELRELERWFADNKFSHLNFARQKLIYCYFSAAATLFSPELSAARVVWAKNGVITTVVDDFFDVGGSSEEIHSFVEAVRVWDEAATDGLSENVQILFSALYNTVDEIVQQAFVFQGRDISIHLREIWYRLVNSMMTEAQWARTHCIPSMHEYMENAEPSIALEPIVLSSLYFVGPKLSEEIICHPEYYNLMHLLNICGRLLNDIQGCKREAHQGKLNSVTLYMEENSGTTMEDAIVYLRKTIDESRQLLLKEVLRPSIVPRECKQLHWNMMRILQLFYLKNDGFTSPTEMLGYVNAVIVDPIL